MASFEHGQAAIHYDDEGDAGGFPVLLITPSGHPNPQSYTPR